MSDSISCASIGSYFSPHTAGGYDAIWLLVFEPNDGTSEPLNAVEKLWEGFPNVSPLLATESKDRGAKVEDINKVPGLRTVVQLRR